MKNKLKEAPHEIGDIVAFKAGGPTMIVIRMLNTAGEYPTVKCEWFDVKGHLKSDTFYQFQLIKKDLA